MVTILHAVKAMWIIITLFFKSYGTTNVKIGTNVLTAFVSLFNWKLIWVKAKDLTWIILINYINYIILTALIRLETKGAQVFYGTHVKTLPQQKNKMKSQL